MKDLTRDVLSFYNTNKDEHNKYIIANLTEPSVLGRLDPFQKSAISNAEIKDISFCRTIDEYNTYDINAWGLRGEIYEDASILGAGCSMTFGVGIPELGRWTNLLGNLLKQNVLNIGNMGATVESMCLDVIKYCMNVKMPEQIFCFFPDFFRRFVVVDKDFYQTREQTPTHTFAKPEVYPDWLALRYCNPKIHLYGNSIFMEIEDRKYIEDATSPHQLILNSINQIYILESFCLTNNIKLYWTTWDLQTHVLLEQLSLIKNFKLKNFKQIFPIGIRKSVNEYIYDSCKWDHDSEFKDNVAWHRGTDYSIINGKKTGELSHPGIHFHYHVAQFFYDWAYPSEKLK